MGIEVQIYKGFKFAIGDHVSCVKPEGWKPARSVFSTISGDRLLIVQRVYQECPGGIQLHYDCRVIHGDGAIADRLIQFNEIELEAWANQEVENGTDG